VQLLDDRNVVPQSRAVQRSPENDGQTPGKPEVDMPSGTEEQSQRKANVAYVWICACFKQKGNDLGVAGDRGDVERCPEISKCDKRTSSGDTSAPQRSRYLTQSYDPEKHAM
jgi:hypothetical protein